MIIPMHLGDYLTGRDEIEVYCSDHIPKFGKWVTIWEIGDAEDWIKKEHEKYYLEEKHFVGKRVAVKSLTKNAWRHRRKNYPNLLLEMRMKETTRTPMWLLAMGSIGSSMATAGALAIALKVGWLGLILTPPSLATWAAFLIIGRRAKRKMEMKDAERLDFFMLSAFITPIIVGMLIAYALSVAWLGHLLMFPTVIGLTALCLRYYYLRKRLGIKIFEV